MAIYNYALTTNQVRTRYLAVTNRPPTFLSNPFTIAGAGAGQSYSATLASTASDPNGHVTTFAKLAGPAWLRSAESNPGKPRQPDQRHQSVDNAYQRYRILSNLRTLILFAIRIVGTFNYTCAGQLPPQSV